MACCSHIAGAGRKAPRPPAARCGLSPRDPFCAIYNGIAAYAEFVGRNYDEAMRLAREGIRQRFDFAGAHRVLTAAAMAGKTDLAKAALQELRRAQPNISLARITDQMSFMQDAEREHYLKAFRRVGWTSSVADWSSQLETSVAGSARRGSP
jgi:hypothetical protein